MPEDSPAEKKRKLIEEIADQRAKVARAEAAKVDINLDIIKKNNAIERQEEHLLLQDKVIEKALSRLKDLGEEE